MQTGWIVVAVTEMGLAEVEGAKNHAVDGAEWLFRGAEVE